jgi:hypothetical protein
MSASLCGAGTVIAGTLAEAPERRNIAPGDPFLARRFCLTLPPDTLRGAFKC